MWVDNSLKLFYIRLHMVMIACGQHTLLSCLVQSSPSELLQYIGLWPIVMIQGRNARFSGDEASYEVTCNKKYY